MVSLILAFYLLASMAGEAQGGPDPDALYRQREDVPRAEQAADIWASRAAGGKDFDAAWKLARATYWIGTHGEPSRRRAALERGVKSGEQAAALNPERPEGHFWFAANMGALAESFGLSQGLKYRTRIKNELERVLAMDPGWQQGSADRGLGWWYHQVPSLFGGSESSAEAHLRKALTYNPRSTATWYFLSEVLISRGQAAEARAAIEEVKNAPIDPDWAPEDRDFKQKAEARLKTLR